MAATKSSSKGRKLSDNDVREIRNRAANSETFTYIAELFGVHRHTVSRIVHYQRRAWVKS